MAVDLTADNVMLDDEIRERMSENLCRCATNAVYHATGIRVRDLPITLDKLLK